MDDGGVLEDDDEAACNIEPEGDGPRSSMDSTKRAIEKTRVVNVSA